ncbi:armadillo-type protein [Hyaloraphidium curvatum]|nr:armadillo-type protein [Hyaloraphidium curvatum]
MAVPASAAPDPHQVHAILATTYLGDPAARSAAEQHLKELENVAGFPSVLLHLIAETSVEPSVKQAAAIYLKNKVTRCWRDDASNVIADHDKEILRANILSVLAKAPRSAMVQLTECVGSMLNNDFPDRWPGFMDAVREGLAGTSVEQIRMGLLATLRVVSVYRWKTEGKRGPLNQIIKATFPQLEKIGSKLLEEESRDAHEMLKLVIKTYFQSIQAELSKTQQDRSWLVSWGNLFIKTILLPPPASAMPEDLDEREKAPLWKAKKWAYRCLNRLFSRYGNPTLENTKKKYGAFAKNFVENFAPLILRTYMSQTASLVSGQIWLSKWAMHSIATFYADSVKLKSTWKLMKPEVPSIIAYFIFPMLCFSSEDAELWEDNPVEFVRKKLDPMEDFKSPEHAAANLLVTLVRDRKSTLAQMFEVVSGVLQSYAQTPTEEMARRKDGALNMVGTVLDVVLADEELKQQFSIEEFAFNHVLPELQSPHAFLRSRACEIFVKLGDYEFENREGVMAVYRGIIGCLKDANLPVRVAAALTLPQLLQHEDVQTAMAPDAALVMNELLKLTNEIDMDTLISVMESLVELFSEQLTPFAVELCTSLRDTFLRIMADTRALDENDDDDAFSEANEKTMAAMGVLKTISTLIVSVESSKDVLARIEHVVVPLVSHILSQRLVDHFDDAFEIVDTLTHCTKTVSQGVWQVFELIFQAIRDSSIDYIEEVLPVLDNIIAHGSTTLFGSHELRKMMLEIINVIMTEEHLSDGDRICGCQLMESLMLHGKQHLDDVIETFLAYAGNYLNDGEPKSDAYLVHLLEVVVNCLLYNPSLALHLLEQQGQTGAFFTLWLQNLDKFVRVHDKRLCILGLCAILSCPVEQIPAVLKAGWSQLGVAFAKLFETWPAAVEAREHLKKLHEEGSDADEEDGEVESEPEDDEDEVEEVDAGSDDDVADEGDEYLDFLASKEEQAEEDGDADDYDWDDAELEEDVYFETPLDTVDPYHVFSTVILDLSNRDQQLFQALTASLDSNQAKQLQEAVAKATAG